MSIARIAERLRGVLDSLAHCRAERCNPGAYTSADGWRAHDRDEAHARAQLAEVEAVAASLAAIPGTRGMLARRFANRVLPLREVHATPAQMVAVRGAGSRGGSVIVARYDRTALRVGLPTDAYIDPRAWLRVGGRKVCLVSAGCTRRLR
jgi:hypothetical protein